MGELMGMARKYRIEPEALPQKLAEIDERLQSLQAAADLEALTQTVARNLAEYQEAAHVLSAMRHQAAGRLGEETTGHMQHLAMKARVSTSSCCRLPRRRTVWSRYSSKLPPTKAIRPVH